jgi:hypothetical protein
MLIKYNGTNVHAFGSPDGKQISWLRPGWNEFPKQIWDMYANHPDVITMLSDKKLELLNEKVEVPSKGKKKEYREIGMTDEPLSLKDLSESKAIEVVKGTYNRDMLQRWLDEENRHKVKRALDAQIKPLLPETQAS